MSDLKLSDELTKRNLIKDRTFSDIEWINIPKVFYLGVDCGSADSLTIGNLAVFLLARRLIDYGWKAVLIVGGATSLIGDPGGKDHERDLAARELIEANAKGISLQVSNLFKNQSFILEDNYNWLKDVKYIDFLRDIGKNFSMTELLQRDYINDRIGENGSGISYAEFSYSIIQGYDFWQLYKQYNVVLQIGGSDQWGNMLSGVPLIRKKEAVEVHAMSMPLVVNKLTGKKFGKSEEGAVWLDSSKTSVLDFYQFWINVDDIDVIDYLKIFTFLSFEKINETAKNHNQDTSKRIAQKLLAYEVTVIVHGKEAADSAMIATAVLRGEEVSSDTAIIGLPTIKVKTPGDILEILLSLNLVSSKTEARRLIESGGIYLNNIQTKKLTIDETDFQNNRIIIRRGKATKDSALIELQI